MTEIRDTQTFAKVLSANTPTVRGTQTLVKVVAANTPSIRDTQTGVKVLAANTPSIRDTQTGVKVLAANTPIIRTTQALIKVLHSTAEAAAEEEPAPEIEVVVSHRYRKSVAKCSEFVSPPCNPVPTDGCCAIIPCSYCLTWDPYIGNSAFGTATWNGTGWTGTIAGRAFVGFWEVGYDSGECEFVVTLSGTEIYRVDCYGGQSCRDSSDSVDTEINGITGTLTWTKILHRPLEYVIDSYSSCRDHFCGDCECACLTLCATLIGADCCETRFEMADVSYQCDGPEWFGSSMCGPTLYEVTIRLTRREYDGACILSGNINGTDLDETELSACIGWTMTWTLYDGTALRVVCDDCDCNTVESCAGGCCWPRVITAEYPCGHNVPVPFEISAPGCNIDGFTDEFTPVTVDSQGTCGSCGAAPPVTIGQINGILKVEVPGFGYCWDTPCGITTYLILECDDTESAGALDACCGKFRLWVGTAERMVGWDGTGPSGGSSSLYWLKFAPSSCSCSPLAAIFDVTLTLDCPTMYADGPCIGEPTCCNPICSGFTVTI